MPARQGHGSGGVAAGARARPPTPAEVARSQRDWNLPRLERAFKREPGRRPFDFFTSGTSQKRPEELARILLSPTFACTVLVDVRAAPTSVHTPEWNKGSIAKLFESKGIRYVHMPKLGVPTQARRERSAGKISDEQFFSWYDREVLAAPRYAELAEITRSSVVALLCTEPGPTHCHRHRIALRLEAERDLNSYDI